MPTHLQTVDGDVYLFNCAFRDEDTPGSDVGRNVFVQVKHDAASEFARERVEDVFESEGRTAVSDLHGRRQWQW